jgi:hypothetical protein
VCTVCTLLTTCIFTFIILDRIRKKKRTEGKGCTRKKRKIITSNYAEMGNVVQNTTKTKGWV